MKRTPILFVLFLMFTAFVSAACGYEMQSPIVKKTPTPQPAITPTPLPEESDPAAIAEVWMPGANRVWDFAFIDPNGSLAKEDVFRACGNDDDSINAGHYTVTFGFDEAPEEGVKVYCGVFWVYAVNEFVVGETNYAAIIEAIQASEDGDVNVFAVAENAPENTTATPEPTTMPEATVTPEPTAVPAGENTSVEVTDEVTDTVGITNTITVNDPRFTLVIPESPIKETGAVTVLSPMEKATIRQTDHSGNYNQTALGTERFIGDAGVFLSSDIPTPDGAWELGVNAYELNFDGPASVNVVEGGFMWFNGKYGTVEVNGMTATCHDYERNTCFVVVYNPLWDGIIDTDFNLRVTVSNYNAGFVQIQRFPAGTVLSEDYFIGNVNSAHRTNSNGFDGASAATLIFLNARTGETTVLEHTIGSELPVSLFANFGILQPVPNS